MSRQFIIIIFMFFCSCVMDRVHKIVEIRNSSNDDIEMQILFDDSTMLSDNMLYHRSNLILKKDSTESAYHMAYPHSYISIYFFNAKSTIYDRKSKKMNGIVKRSFLKRIVIPKDSLKKNKLIIFK